MQDLKTRLDGFIAKLGLEVMDLKNELTKQKINSQEYERIEACIDKVEEIIIKLNDIVY